MVFKCANCSHFIFGYPCRRCNFSPQSSFGLVDRLDYSVGQGASSEAGDFLEYQLSK